MFEDATFDSQGTITTSSRRWSLAAFALNGSVLAAMIIFPLIHPEAIPHRIIDIALAPPPAQHAPDPVPTQRAASRAQGARSATMPNLGAPVTIPKFINTAPVLSDPAWSRPLAMNMPATGIPGGDVFRGVAVPVHLVMKTIPPVVISKGVAAGMLISRTIPNYPAIARAAHVEGTVVLHALISKSGAVVNLRVEGGPTMLQQAALDAVAQWRYRPYLLNGSPVEVETTVNVVFSLGR